jgi:hypothetical protein
MIVPVRMKWLLGLKRFNSSLIVAIQWLMCFHLFLNMLCLLDLRKVLI